MKIGAIFGLVGSILFIIDHIIWIMYSGFNNFDFVDAMYRFFFSLSTYFLNPAGNICLLVFFIMFLLNIKKADKLSKRNN